MLSDPRQEKWWTGYETNCVLPTDERKKSDIISELKGLKIRPGTVRGGASEAGDHKQEVLKTGSMTGGRG